MNTDTRTNDELNRVIAEFMGFTLWESKRGEYTLQYAWTPGNDPVSGVRRSAREEYKKTNWKVDWSKYDYGRFSGKIPNYCRDLNAVHEAVMSRPVSERIHVNYVMCEMLRENDAYFLDRCINSTARQRAEALVRVIEEAKK